MIDPLVSAVAAVDELDSILERETGAPFARALNASCPGDSAPHWRELTRNLRRAAELADWLSNRKG